MIAGGVRMHGFETQSFARLGALAVRRQAERSHELHVLHEAGRVLSVVDTARGRLRGVWEDVTDPIATARRLREEHGVDRVVVADAEALREMLASVEADVTQAWSQPDVFLALQHGFRDCAGVVCDPPSPSLQGWDEIRRSLAVAGDGRFVLAASDVPDWPIALGGIVEGGLIVEVADLSRDEVAMLPELSPGVVVAIVVTMEQLAAALSSADAGSALMRHLILRESAR